MKQRLRAHFAAVLQALHARVAEGTPRAAGRARDHAAHGGRVLVIAFGKAARPMATALLSHLPLDRVRGLLVPPEPDAAPLPPLEVLPGGHPLPTAGSFAAAARALALCQGATAADHVVFLVSGGGSALLELPLDAGVDVAAWRRFYAALVGSGAGIDRINAIRRRFSQVKGGRLALAAGHAAGLTTVLVRDVPGPLEDVASGPTCSFGAAPDTLRQDLAAFDLLTALPECLRERLQRGAIPPLPRVAIAEDPRSEWVTVLEEADAQRQIAALLQADGIAVEPAEGADDVPIDTAVARLLDQLERLRARHSGRPVAIVATGELSVPLPARPGVGGRNQQFALHLATAIAGRPITALSCGTDGIDGNSPAAGAIVGGDTLARASARGFDVHGHLQRFDAYPLLQALGDTVITGPTGTNVRDLRVLVHGG